MSLRREALVGLLYAPFRRRGSLARKIMALPPTAFEQSPSIAVDCEIRSLERWQFVYPHLAMRLGRPGKLPAPQQVTNLESLLQHRRPYVGAISSRDCFFLTAVVSVIAPERMVEVGTLTGFSAAVIALAIIAERGNGRRPAVETIDSATTCMVAPEPVGFEIPQLLPQYPEAVRVHAGRDSRILAELFAPAELPLAFIDADHQHPFPLLDVLRLAPFICAEGWLVLHDIALGTVGEGMRARGESLQYGAPFGAEWLFQAWPFPKINGGNIGAIQMPKDRRALLPFSLKMMRRPFEGGRGRQHRRLRRMLYHALSFVMESTEGANA